MVDDPIHQALSSNDPETSSSYHPLGEVKTLVFYFLMADLDDKTYQVMFPCQDEGMSLFVGKVSLFEASSNA